MNNILKYIQLLLIFFLIRKEKARTRENTLLLLKLDSIGDYILFRNFIYALRKDKRYSDKEITLCGNSVYRDLAETYDRELFDDFIWIDRLKFLNDFSYKFKVLKDIRGRGFEIVIETLYSREILFGDAVVKASGAPVRTGSTVTENLFSTIKKKIFSDRYYTNLIETSAERKFEFYRNKEFFTKLLGYDPGVAKTFIDFSKVNFEFRRSYVVLFPGAAMPNRMWSSDNFRMIAEYILKNYDYDIIAAGAPDEKEIAEKVRPSGAGDRFRNLCGESLSILPAVIGNAELLITNDTSAYHVAAAVDVPFICIANGNAYGRFFPYPEEVFGKGYYLVPPGFTKPEPLDINSISPAEVISLTDKILKKIE